MNSIERFYKIHQLLSFGRKISRERLMAVTEVSRATLMRDIEKMRNYLGAPIQWHPAPQEGYYYDPHAERFELPGFWFNASELYALLASDRLMQSVTPGGLITPFLEPMRRHIQGILHRSGLDPIKVAHYFLIRSHGRVQTNPVNFQKIAQALQERHPLALTYLARSNDQQSHRLVDPQRLIHHRENWYLIGWCRQKQGLRTFALAFYTEKNEPSVW